VLLAALLALAISSGAARAQAPDEGDAGPTPPPRSHDWRAPGFPSVVGGQLYDPSCVPLTSIGGNVPNLPFRSGLAETLELFRASHIRWMRVFATGHGMD